MSPSLSCLFAPLRGCVFLDVCARARVFALGFPPLPPSFLIPHMSVVCAGVRSYVSAQVRKCVNLIVCTYMRCAYVCV